MLDATLVWELSENVVNLWCARLEPIRWGINVRTVRCKTEAWLVTELCAAVFANRPFPPVPVHGGGMWHPTRKQLHTTNIARGNA